MQRNTVVFVGNQWLVRLRTFDSWFTRNTYTCKQNREFNRILDTRPGNIIVPLMELDALTTSRHAAPTTAAVVCCAPTEDMMTCFWTKITFLRFCEQHAHLLEHIPHHVFSLEEASSRIACDPKLRFIAKPATASQGLTHVILPASPLAWTLLPDLWTAYVVQEMVSNKHEYVTHIVAQRGKIVFDITYEYTFGTDVYVKGPVREHTCFEKVPLPSQDRTLFETFLLPCAYSGACNVNFKRKQNGEPCILEINPRFGGSLMLEKTQADLYVFLQYLVHAFSV